jgi:hypothetical protein
MNFYIAHASGGAERLARKLPFKGLLGPLIRETRMSFLVNRKG